MLNTIIKHTVSTNSLFSFILEQYHSCAVNKYYLLVIIYICFCCTIINTKKALYSNKCYKFQYRGIHMAKSSKKQIYEDELKVIAELQKNGKENIESISRKCGFSRQKIWRIIKVLEEDKTIWGYTAIVNDEKINMNRYVMLIKKSVAKIDNAVEGEEIGVNIDYSLYLHGEYDWMLIFTAKDIKHAKRFSEIITSQYSDVIKDVKLMETLFSVQKAGIINPEVGKLKEFL